MKNLVFVLSVICLLASCDRKKKEKVDTSKYFPVLSYLQSQVKKIDTSLYSITKIETTGKTSDTSFIKREEVRALAKDFLDIPDITNPKFGSDYKETNLYDSLLGVAVLSYTSTDEDLETSKQDVTIIPSFGGNDLVKTIYIEKNKSDDGTIIEKKLIWEVDKYFYIRTITKKNNDPEIIHDLKIIWKDFLSY